MLSLEQQIFNQIEKAKEILVVFPAEPEGDAVASALAIYLFLKKTGKQVSIAGIRPPKERRHLSFLPGYDSIEDELSNLRRFIVSIDISRAKVNQIKYVVDNDTLNFIISPAEGWFEPEDVSARAGEFRYDLIISVGAKDLESLGDIYNKEVEFFYKTPIINIDCQAANDEYGQINLLDLNTVSISEIVYMLFREYTQEKLDEDVATCLLAGIIHKTRNFKTANLTPRTLLGTSQLIAAGARREEIVTRLYRSRGLNTLKIWGNVLNNLHSERDGELIWSKLELEDGQNDDDICDGLEDIVDELIANIPKARIALIFCRRSDSETEIIAYSLKNIDVFKLFTDQNPVRKAKAAVFTIDSRQEEAIPKFLTEVQEKLEKLNK